jgi:hypothetical protein
LFEIGKADGVLVASIDDGKVNALSTELVADLRSALALATGRGRPLVITGSDGCFSAGFDLAVMNGGDQQLASALFAEGAQLYREIIEAPVPVVASCTGHALAGGAILLLCADYRIGRAGSYRLGLNEVGIGMPFRALPSPSPPTGWSAGTSPRLPCSRRSSRRIRPWPWGSSTRSWMIPCRDRSRTRCRWPHCRENPLPSPSAEFGRASPRSLPPPMVSDRVQIRRAGGPAGARLIRRVAVSAALLAPADTPAAGASGAESRLCDSLVPRAWRPCSPPEPSRSRRMYRGDAPRGRSWPHGSQPF